MNLSIILFLIGILGFILNRKNIILMIISIEIMLLAVTLLILIIIAFYEVGICGSSVKIELLSWLDIDMLSISWCFYFDQLTVSLGLAVLYCSTLIHIYSIDYLSSDPHIQRFFSYLSAFTAGMLILICGGNFFVMFVG